MDARPSLGGDRNMTRVSLVTAGREEADRGARAAGLTYQQVSSKHNFILFVKHKCFAVQVGNRSKSSAPILYS